MGPGVGVELGPSSCNARASPASPSASPGPAHGHPPGCPERAHHHRDQALRWRRCRSRRTEPMLRGVPASCPAGCPASAQIARVRVPNTRGCRPSTRPAALEAPRHESGRAPRDPAPGQQRALLGQRPVVHREIDAVPWRRGEPPVPPALRGEPAQQLRPEVIGPLAETGIGDERERFSLTGGRDGGECGPCVGIPPVVAGGRRTAEILGLTRSAYQRSARRSVNAARSRPYPWPGATTRVSSESKSPLIKATRSRAHRADRRSCRSGTRSDPVRPRRSPRPRRSHRGGLAPPLAKRGAECVDLDVRGPAGASGWRPWPRGPLQARGGLGVPVA